MGNLEKALNDIETQELIEKDESETLKEIEHVRNKTGINFTRFSKIIKKTSSHKCTRDRLVLLYQMWCGQMSSIKSEYWQKPEEWIIEHEKKQCFLKK
jgi:hypothetical protein